MLERSFDEKSVTVCGEASAAEEGITRESFGGLHHEKIVPIERSFTFLTRLVLRKLDLHLFLPLLVLFIFDILDRTNTAISKLGGLTVDLNLTGVQYQTAVAVFFVAYLGLQIPSNIALSRSRPALYLPAAVVIWGGITLCFAALKDYLGIIGARIVLGVAESVFFPRSLLMITSWYKPREAVPRVATLYCGNLIGNGLGGLLAADVLDGLENTGGLVGWRWLYIIEGTGTIVAGLLAFCLLPDFPRSQQPSWLTLQEHRSAQWRMLSPASVEGDENETIAHALKATVTAVKVWALVAVQNMVLTTQTWMPFFPSIMKTLGFENKVTLLLTAPVYFFGVIGVLSNCFIAARTGHRAVLIVWPLAVAIGGNVMLISSTAMPVQDIGMFLMCVGSYSAFTVVQAWVASTIPSSKTKRAVAIAMVKMLGGLSNVYGSYFWPDSDAPRYLPGSLTLLSFAAGGILCTMGLGMHLSLLNRKAAKIEEESGCPQYRYTI
ncbi:hypothetical protein CLAFUW4_13954 [Fulvia fulva]|uniref:Major facilitator superfamily (MFS) profile domain-containing protein n=1 Tax=Passalora fulva TaxID=5499 RepID=A0A9Q8PL05_PASFU|nr:uncharacterized protein CLAFUR5_13794 [Fulvia fulva]KAK4610140.1 hypothetical protein CLAFUR4_13957 [Fulvia fulva]KAK4611108.1 hypothetical protein CLAFUR0_13961 [Fulvia fulva]UJO24403.1 hypothetical protein CLAFUR5_13794 [Fulvia fulva]WPV22225.1 hypothetical protein CLAFUW4_13954 [Fulvia fulva]WPV36747.1 hypothetical protein CLAFUW7_13962 [Fulvia fulva]